MIPKRPKKTAAYYSSTKYKRELRLKYFKWSHMKVATVYYTKFTTRFDPKALDWVEQDRTKVMEKRAQAMLDTMILMLKIRLEQVPREIKERAIANIT